MNAGVALLGGLTGCASWIAVAYVCHALWPRRCRFNPLYFLGAAITIETTAAYAIGTGIALAVSLAYALFIGALVFGFDATEYGWLVGLARGLAASIVSGSTLAYSGLLHRGVRNEAVHAPGMFLITHGPPTVLAFLAWHALHGVIVGVVYAALV